MNEEEIEYTLKKINEAPADEKQRKSDDIQGKTKNMV